MTKFGSVFLMMGWATALLCSRPALSAPADPEARFLIRQDAKAGYIDRTGKVVIEPQFTAAQEFNHGLAVVTLATGEKAVIDPGGKIRFKLAEYRVVRSFFDGLAMVGNAAGNGFIDTQGKLVIAPRPLMFGNFSEGLASCTPRTGGKAGYLDRSGRIVIPQQFDTAHPFADGLAAVAVEGKYGLIDKSGRFAVPPTLVTVGGFSDGCCKISRSAGQSEFIDTNGVVLWTVPAGWTVGMFSEGLAPYKEGNRWGFVDKRGEKIIPAQFEKAENFNEGQAAVQLKGRWGCIDRAGAQVIKPQFSQPPWFKNGLAKTRAGKVEGYIDPAGQWVWKGTL